MPTSAEGEGDEGTVVNEREGGRREGGRGDGGGDGGGVCVEEVRVEGAEEVIGETRREGGAEVTGTGVEAGADEGGTLIRSEDAE